MDHGRFFPFPEKQPKLRGFPLLSRYHGSLHGGCFRALFLVFLAFGGALWGAGDSNPFPETTHEGFPFEGLRTVAANSLLSNIHDLKSGSYLSAGGNQFKALWTRDFCYSARGLLQIGRNDVVRDQLDLLIRHFRREDGLLPRTFDSFSLAKRYIVTFLHLKREIKDPLKPEYGDPQTKLAIDSNALFLLTAINYMKRTSDYAWWVKNELALVKLYRFYDRFKENEDPAGLIMQPEFSDWQDSIRREGMNSLTNILFYAASQRLKRFPAFHISDEVLERMREKIVATFQDPATGLFRAVAGKPQICLDSNLAAIDTGFFLPSSDEARKLYSSLKASPLWARNPGIPGFPTWPDYPSEEVAASAKLVGLRSYHGSVYWSWLMGLSARVADVMGDPESSERILSVLQAIALRDGVISEIYEPVPPFKRWRNPIYKSESPFSWGSGMILDAIEHHRKRTPLLRPPQASVSGTLPFPTH